MEGPRIQIWLQRSLGLGLFNLCYCSAILLSLFTSMYKTVSRVSASSTTTKWHIYILRHLLNTYALSQLTSFSANSPTSSTHITQTPPLFNSLRLQTFPFPSLAISSFF